jgi:hypothetical protein
MKKMFTLSIISIITTLLFSGCVKERAVFDESYWLNQERGEVVYSDSYCSYYVVETLYGYTIIRGSGSAQPYEGSILYGDFGHYGSGDFYNRSSSVVIRGEVVEYDLSYADAQYALDDYCPYARGKGVERIKKSASVDSKISRPKK